MTTMKNRDADRMEDVLMLVGRGFGRYYSTRYRLISGASVLDCIGRSISDLRTTGRIVASK